MPTGPAAQLTSYHSCPLFNPGKPPPPHVGGPVVSPSAPTVLISGMPPVGPGSMAICQGPPDNVIIGSATVLAGGIPVSRINDSTAHGGLIVVGAPTVIVGG